MIKLKYRIFYILFICFLLKSCSGTSNISGGCFEPLSDSQLFPCSKTNIRNILGSLSQNTIFLDTKKINIPSYNYYSKDLKLIKVFGDTTIEKLANTNSCCNFSQIVDKYPAEPVFKWNTFQSNLIAVAIFKNTIKLSVDGKRIQNVDEIVWSWNSGMGTGSQVGGNIEIQYQDGRDVKNGQTLSSITKLERNVCYFWGVWGWDDKGINVAYSSRAIPFIVENLPLIPVFSTKQIEGSWTLSYAIDSQNGNNNSVDFPIRQFSGYIDCDESSGVNLLRYSTKPNNIQGTLSINNYKDVFKIENVFFSNLFLECDNKLSGKAIFNNREYYISYYK